MVNLKAIIYINKDQEITIFKTEHDFISWLANKCVSADKVNEWKYNYYCKTRDREKRLEDLFNLRSGLLIGAHIVFSSAQLMELYVAKKEVLEVIEDDDHAIILEIRRSPLCNVATFYSKDHQFSLLIDRKDPIIDEDVERRVGREARIPRLD